MRRELLIDKLTDGQVSMNTTYCLLLNYKRVLLTDASATRWSRLALMKLQGPDSVTLVGGCGNTGEIWEFPGRRSALGCSEGTSILIDHRNS